ncbi:MAG: hypothetical protein HQL79_11500 [Magnetococcales bacterium]|nr:hypothetical protein [Magnetococcales bacterium]
MKTTDKYFGFDYSFSDAMMPSDIAKIVGNNKKKYFAFLDEYDSKEYSVYKHTFSIHNIEDSKFGVNGFSNRVQRISLRFSVNKKQVISKKIIILNDYLLVDGKRNFEDQVSPQAVSYYIPGNYLGQSKFFQCDIFVFIKRGLRENHRKLKASIEVYPTEYYSNIIKRSLTDKVGNVAGHHTSKYEWRFAGKFVRLLPPKKPINKVLNVETDKPGRTRPSEIGEGNMDMINNCDLLLVVATDVERDAVLSVGGIDVSSGKLPLIHRVRRTYFDIGCVEGARVLLVQSEVGSNGPGASQQTISDALNDFNPSYIVMLGIAFGVDSNKQEIGNILVSQQLQCYELQRVGTKEDTREINILFRGDRVTASTTLLSRFRASSAGWRGPKVEFGLVLSGEKLVDNIDYRDKLIAIAPEAIGGEMEGVGLYTAAVDRKKDWILVKAVCDWADGEKRLKKRERQEKAAQAAAEFVFQTVKLGGLSAITNRDNQVNVTPLATAKKKFISFVGARQPSAGNVISTDQLIKALFQQVIALNSLEKDQIENVQDELVKEGFWEEIETGYRLTEAGARRALGYGGIG